MIWTEIMKTMKMVTCWKDKFELLLSSAKVSPGLFIGSVSFSLLLPQLCLCVVFFIQFCVT